MSTSVKNQYTGKQGKGKSVKRAIIKLVEKELCKMAINTVCRWIFFKGFKG